MATAEWTQLLRQQVARKNVGRRTRRELVRQGAATAGIALAACGAPGPDAAPAVAKLPAVVVWASNTGQADLPYFERFAKWFEEANP
ncbi:MAG: hypothetical protein M3442_17960, partial [Chloroflexota bacterium]|nr:hypothetical protein [Chloroflexota bacterium]